MKPFFTFLFACLLVTNTSIGTTYYVATSGSDSNSGLSSTVAFLTINKGINTAASYDSIIVMAGTYPIFAPLNIGKPLTLIGQGSHIDGGSWSASTPYKRLLQISNTNDVFVSGFVFKNLIGDFSIGVAITGSGRNITVRNCLITNIGWTGNNLTAIPTNSNNANGVLIYGETATALSQINILEDTITNCALGFSEALTAVGNVDTFTIARNFIYANSNIGIDIAGSKSWTTTPSSVNYARNGMILNNTVFRCMSPVGASAGIYLDGAYNCLVESNTVFENAVGISIGQESPLSTGAKPCSKNKIVNNKIFHNAATGVVWGDTQKNNTHVVNNFFGNNTLFKNRTGAIINGVTAIGPLQAGNSPGQYGDIYGGEILLQSSDSSLFENNIIFPLGIRHCVVLPDSNNATNLLFNYNNFSRENNNVSYFDIGPGSSANGSNGIQTYFTSNVAGLYINTVVGYPDFVDTANLNFHLKSSLPFSNCINAGNPASTTSSVSHTDFDNNPRIQGNRIDIGALESNVTLTVKEVSETNFDIAIFPNPATTDIHIQSTENLSRVYIIDVLGSIVLDVANPSGSIKINHLPPGLYQAKFIGMKGHIIVRKVVKL
ncbi:MAG TPA: T9SS type A sorting domain-containing protein [Flavipsychrobacter sp.]|nr:T9SS type A sorting domain-containing protein [Flavipsychrobacter sp.]